LSLLSKCSTSLATLQLFLCMSYFSGRVSCFCLGPAFSLGASPTYVLLVSYLAGITGTHTTLLVDIRFHYLFCPGWHQTLIPFISIFYIMEIIGVNH
jgi:hypothetical protein